MTDNIIEEQIIEQDISEKLADNYTRYALAVITDRALPDIRDGLKNVHRRILYAMSELKNDYNKPHKKSARIVGEVLGKFHPHGDQSVYDASVRLAQDFSMRYPLLNGQGNFGSIDGDKAAAMRYTEIRMSKIGQSMLDDIHKDTVDFQPNFDDTLEEPVVLPTHFPNLLANGSSGIAVGMSSYVPPHNVYDIYLVLELILDSIIDDKPYEIDDLIEIIKAPDFPTGGTIVYNDNIIKGYKTGRGNVQVKAKYEITENQIIVTEIPFNVNKSNLMAKIEESKNNQIPEIRSVVDESSKEGIRVVITAKRGESPDLIMAKLLKYTQLKSSVPMNFTVLDGDKPIEASLEHMLTKFIEHSVDILTRKSKYDLNKAEEREHILSAIVIALENIDDIIDTIRSSKDNKYTIKNLMSKYEFTEVQAKAITEIRLRTLNNMSIDSTKQELDEVNQNIKELNNLLSDRITILKEVKSIYEIMRSQFSPDRKSEITYEDKFSNLDKVDFIKEENIVISLTHKGLIKSTLESEYRSTNRNTRGSRTMDIGDDDYIEYVFTTNTHSQLYIITNKGIAHKIDAFKIPVTSRTTKGRYINQYLSLEEDERILDILPVDPKSNLEDKVLLIGTKQGFIKKTQVKNIMTTRDTVQVIGLREDDEIAKAIMTKDTNQEVLMVTAAGQGARINTGEINPVKTRSSIGVIGMRLKIDGDSVVDMTPVNNDERVLIIGTKGLGKRLNVQDEVILRNRGSVGVKVMNINNRTGLLMGALSIKDDDTVLFSTKQGLLVKLNTKDIKSIGRNTSGVKLVNLSKDDEIVSASISLEEDIEENDDE